MQKEVIEKYQQSKQSDYSFDTVSPALLSSLKELSGPARKRKSIPPTASPASSGNILREINDDGLLLHSSEMLQCDTIKDIQGIRLILLFSFLFLW